ncbi:hypothetical protein WJ47_17060 [Burkholderia ubonensis]|uniref:Uncharacterized protein n=1 Tax=Burkholderia ubonensis TaxID=101571 RepID=A0AB73FXG7_9BURK|nr:hypothetical protein WJ47_17060 [Burkholderia ubonensis]KVM28598.1 hypothetical protein WJ53_09050 [Burkholderia ubonensis]KVM35109.1 hypothetical protein WJ54_36040 [Burkholderia ubonensis]
MQRRSGFENHAVPEFERLPERTMRSDCTRFIRRHFGGTIREQPSRKFVKLIDQCDSDRVRSISDTLF